MKVKSESEVARSLSDPQRPHGLQPSRLLHPWDSPGKSTGVGCHCLLQLLWYNLEIRVYMCNRFTFLYSRNEHNIINHLYYNQGFPGGSGGKESAYNSGHSGRCEFDPQVRRIPWWRTGQPTLVFLSGESHGQRSPIGYSPCGCKESDKTEMTERTHKHSPIKIKNSK